MPGREFTLTVDGAVERPLCLTLEDLLALPTVQREVTLDCGKGTRTTSTMRGVAISRLIELAEASDSASMAVFHCTDGHRERMSLADLINCGAFLAFAHEGDGPVADRPGVRLVVPGKFGERWAKYVQRLEIVAEG